MHALFLSLVLSTLLVSRAFGDTVTSERCPAPAQNIAQRVRRYPEDGDATFLWLANCRLNAGLNASLLVGLPNILSIELIGNAIAHIDLAPFRSVPILREISLSVNNLREMPAFPKGSCSSLTKLRLNYNKLTGIYEAGTFSACAQLQDLYLYGNDIKYIHPDVFRSLAKLETIDLHDNKLVFIPDQMFARNTKLRELHLFNNRLSYLSPGFATIFKHAGGGLKLFYFYDNPWHCACLLELMADVKRAGALFDSKHVHTFSDLTSLYTSVYRYEYKYDSKPPVCMYNGAGPCCRPGRLLPPLSHAAEGGR